MGRAARLAGEAGGGEPSEADVGEPRAGREAVAPAALHRGRLTAAAPAGGDL